MFVAPANYVDSKGQHVFIGPHKYTHPNGHTYSFVMPAGTHEQKRAPLFAVRPNFASLYGLILVLPFNRLALARPPTIARGKNRTSLSRSRTPVMIRVPVQIDEKVSNDGSRAKFVVGTVGVTVQKQGDRGTSSSVTDVDALILKGLAIHKPLKEDETTGLGFADDDSTDFVITHVSSGGRLTVCGDLLSAKKLVLRLIELADWTQKYEELVKDAVFNAAANKLIRDAHESSLLGEIAAIARSFNER